MRRRFQSCSLQPSPSTAGRTLVKDMVRHPLGFIASMGPATAQDRWEESDGINPFTLGVCIAAQVSGAYLLEPSRSLERERRVLDLGHCDALAPRLGAKGYFVRVAPRRESSRITRSSSNSLMCGFGFRVDRGRQQQIKAVASPRNHFPETGGPPGVQRRRSSPVAAAAYWAFPRRMRPAPGGRGPSNALHGLPSRFFSGWTHKRAAPGKSENGAAPDRRLSHRRPGQARRYPRNSSAQSAA